MTRVSRGSPSYSRRGNGRACDLKTSCVPVALSGQEMATRWETSSPKVAKQLREGLGDCLTVMSFPSEHQRSLTSTNMLESLMKRLKKRTRVVGVFPNKASCDRLIGAQLMEVHEQWLTEGMAYFKMEARRQMN